MKNKASKALKGKRLKTPDRIQEMIIAGKLRQINLHINPKSRVLCLTPGIDPKYVEDFIKGLI